MCTKNHSHQTNWLLASSLAGIWLAGCLMVQVTEKTDSHLDNLKMGLALWEKLLQLGGEVESWTGDKMVSFAEGHPFHSEQEVQSLQVTHLPPAGNLPETHSVSAPRLYLCLLYLFYKSVNHHWQQINYFCFFCLEFSPFFYPNLVVNYTHISPITLCY